MFCFVFQTTICYLKQNTAKLQKYFQANKKMQQTFNFWFVFLKKI